MMNTLPGGAATNGQPVAVRDGTQANENARIETAMCPPLMTGLGGLCSVRSPEAVAAEVRLVKQLRRDIDAITQQVKALPGSRERSLAVTKLQEATMWLGMDLKRIGEANPGLVANPYPNSKNPDSPVIEPTADGLKM